jgi:diadenosine tetraphosphate (Ap4A) HIT family hydrolase
MSLPQQVEAIHAGTEPALVCQVNSGWVVLGKMQYLRSYCILIPDPLVPSLNALNPIQQAAYLADMTLIGEALLEVTGAYRINYAILGNTEPFCTLILPLDTCLSRTNIAVIHPGPIQEQ